MEPENNDNKNLTPATELNRDERADHPGVNTTRDNEDVKVGSQEASQGVGDQTQSKTEAARGTSGQ